MRIPKLAVIFIAGLIVLAVATLFKFDVFKAYAVIGFILALDSQIVMAAKAIREQAINDAIKNMYKDGSDGSN